MNDSRSTIRLPRIGLVIAGTAVTLAVASGLHLSAGPPQPSPAGIAEAILCLALGSGSAAIKAGLRDARAVATATVGLAVVGFGVGLSITARGGATADIAYHAAMLPILLATLAALLRRQTGDVTRNTRRPRASE